MYIKLSLKPGQASGTCKHNHISPKVSMATAQKWASKDDPTQWEVCLDWDGWCLTAFPEHEYVEAAKKLGWQIIVVP